MFAANVFESQETTRRIKTPVQRSRLPLKSPSKTQHVKIGNCWRVVASNATEQANIKYVRIGNCWRVVRYANNATEKANIKYVKTGKAHISKLNRHARQCALQMMGF